jgi:uncharacterized integral membrane protein
MLAKIIFLVIVLILGATFSTLNRQEISLQYFFGWQTAPFPLFLLILGALALGVILGFTIGWGERWKFRSKARDLGEQIKTLQEDIETLTPKEGPPESSIEEKEVQEPPRT